MMLSLNRFTSKELALAYLSQQQQTLSPAEFLAAVEKAEAQFSQLLKQKNRPEFSASSRWCLDN